MLAKKLSKFDREIAGFADYLTDPATATRLRVLPGQVDELQAARDAWTVAFAAYEDVATRTRAATAAVYNACDAAQPVVRGLRQQIRHSYKLDLSAADITALGITPIARHRSRARRELDAPMNIVVETRLGAVEFSSKSPAHFHHTAMPPGAREIIREIAYLPTGAKPADADFHFIDAVGRAHHTVVIPQAIRGRGLVGWLRTRFADSRGRTSPPSAATQFGVLGG